MRLFEDINYLGPVYVDGRLNNHITIHWFAPEVWIIQGGQTVRRQFSLAFFLGNGSCFRKSCAIFNKGVIEMIMMTLRSILVHMAYSRPHSSVHARLGIDTWPLDYRSCQHLHQTNLQISHSSIY